MYHQENIDWHMARSNVYGLLGSLLSERPEAKTICRLLQPETVGYLKSMFADPMVASSFSELADDYGDGRISAEEVALDFESLMKVPGRWYVHPFESAYSFRRENSKNSKWGELCGTQTRSAERYYYSEGLEPSYDRVDFADHIGLELTFMAHLCNKTAEAMQTEHGDQSKHFLFKQQEFAQTHLLNWAEDFSTELRDKSRTPFFHAVAEMLAAFVELEKNN